MVKDFVFYEECGDRDGLPLVILHLLATDHRSMKAWLEPIFQEHTGIRRIYVDIPAHGNSKLPEWVTTTDDILALLLDTLDDLLGDQPFCVLGMSYGGYLAQGILGKRQKQVNGLCLLCPVVHTKVRSVPEKIVLTRDTDVLEELETDVATAFETLFVHQTIEHREMFLKEIQPGRLLANRPFLGSDWRTHGYHYAVQPLSRELLFPQPTLILPGRQDAIAGYKDQFALLEQFPHASYVVLDQAGHMLQIEHRSIVQAHVAKWLDRL